MIFLISPRKESLGDNSKAGPKNTMGCNFKALLRWR